MSKRTEFVKNMRMAGLIASRVLSHTCKYAKEGVTTAELDLIADEYTKALGATSACIGYKGYPKAICTSPNDILCHGVPSYEKLKQGDIINIDVTVIYKGYHGDTSKTIYIDGDGIDPDKEVKLKLINASKQAMEAGISAIRPYGTTGEIGAATWRSSLNYPDFNLVPTIGGHGIGLKFHMEPFIPAIGSFGMGDLLKPWTCVTVEPILVYGNPEFDEIDIEGSTVKVYKTKTGAISSHFEHTILITDSGNEILTYE